MYLRLAIVGFLGIGFCIFAMFMLQDVTKGLAKGKKSRSEGNAGSAPYQPVPARVTASVGPHLPLGPLDPAKHAAQDAQGIVPDSLSQHARRELIQVFTLRAGRRPSPQELEELVAAFHRDVLALPTRLVEARLAQPSTETPVEKGE